MTFLLAALWVAGLAGAGHAYYHFHRSRDRRRARQVQRILSPEPIPELQDAGDDLGR